MLKVDNAAVRASQLAKLEKLRAERDEGACRAALDQLTRAAGVDKPGPDDNLLALAIDAARAKATVGEISTALEKVCGRYTGQIRTISGIYRAEVGESSAVEKMRAAAAAFEKAEGRRPRILVAKMGQDGHDRGQKVIASAFADLGFDVDVGPLFQTPGEVARQAVEADVHVVGVNSLAAGHLSLVPALKKELDELGRDDIMIVVGGVIPPGDFDELRRRRSGGDLPAGHGHPGGSRRPARRADEAAGLRGRTGRLRAGVSPAGPAHVDIEELAKGVLDGKRGIIGRAITLVESSRADHRQQAQELLTLLLPHTGHARRVGISGVPGAGKSTLINALGSRLTAAGSRVAVLAVDPSSTRTGGSILGDKTRMPQLATDDNAFIRPSPTSGQLGGVARATRESILVMEAAGYDVVIVETVGVGQSETLVAEMTDTFVLLALARTGDQLQGIKKGVLELADVVAVNKADGPHEIECKRAARELAGALRLLSHGDQHWQVPVLTCSAETGNGLDELWKTVERHQQALRDSGELERRRGEQQVVWTWDTVRDRLMDRLHASAEVSALVPQIERAVRKGQLPPSLAADRILEAFLDHPSA